MLAAAIVARLLPTGGADGQVLGRADGAPAWQAAGAAGTIAAGSIALDKLAAAVVARLLPSGGSNGQFLSRSGGAPAWVAAPSGGGLPSNLRVGLRGGFLYPVVSTVSFQTLKSDGSLEAPVRKAVPPGAIVDGAVDTAALKDGAVNQHKLQAASVSAIHIKDNAIVTREISDGQVTLAKLAADAIARMLPTGGSNGQILGRAGGLPVWQAAPAGGTPGAGSITVAMLAAAVVARLFPTGGSTGQVVRKGSSGLEWHTPATASVNAQTVATALFGYAGSFVQERHLLSDSVTEHKIKNGAVTRNKLAANSVETAKIRDFSVTQSKLGSGAVGANQLASNAVISDRIAASNLPLKPFRVPANDDAFNDAEHSFAAAADAQRYGPQYGSAGVMTMRTHATNVDHLAQLCFQDGDLYIRHATSKSGSNRNWSTWRQVGRTNHLPSQQDAEVAVKLTTATFTTGGGFVPLTTSTTDDAYTFGPAGFAGELPLTDNVQLSLLRHVRDLDGSGTDIDVVFAAAPAKLQAYPALTNNPATGAVDAGNRLNRSEAASRAVGSVTMHFAMHRNATTGTRFYVEVPRAALDLTGDSTYELIARHYIGV